MGYFVILPIPYDILDAAIAENLSYFADGFLEFTRSSASSASTIYHLRQEQLGDVGEFRIRKLLDEKSELYIKDPQISSSRDWTEDEKASLQSQIMRDDKLKVIQKVSKKIDSEKDELQYKKIAHLEKAANGLLQRLKSDPFTWPENSHGFVSLETFLDEFASTVKSHLRMSFWQSENSKHKWVTRPESHAKSLFLASLISHLGRSALIFDEVGSGAGYIDIYVVLSNGEKAIIELKMCGNSYSSNYAVEGITQILHYIQNREAKAGYLLVFDGRSRDFGTGMQPDIPVEGLRIITKIVDVRPTVKD
jgi:hypothetical protein